MSIPQMLKSLVFSTLKVALMNERASVIPHPVRRRKAAVSRIAVLFMSLYPLKYLFSRGRISHGGDVLYRHPRRYMEPPRHTERLRCADLSRGYHEGGGDIQAPGIAPGYIISMAL